jgi:tyrosyl-tRNA synthetase
MQSALLKDFTARGLIADVSRPDELDHHLASGVRTLYCGFDPTADSLHVGSLLPLLALRRFQLHGHRPIVLIGGGTGLIGDPSGKAGERALNAEEQVGAWAERLRRQVGRFLDFSGARPALLLDNYAWLSRLEVIPFLRDIGKEFSIAPMIARESVKARLATGLSYTEFSYQILQAYDFLVLCRDHDCTIQIGGSDQWGNITAGMDLIRRKLGVAAYGLTLPLVTKTDGAKFGKTEAGTIWLDPAKTSPYEFYQFWINTADADVGTFLRYFTFLTAEEIADLEGAVRRAPEKREAQRALAREVTRLVHGEAALAEAERITEALFTGDLEALTERELAQACERMPRTAVSAAAFRTASIVDILVTTGLAESKKRGRELIAAGAIHVNGRRIATPDVTLAEAAGAPGRCIVLRKGKKTYHAVTVG